MSLVLLRTQSDERLVALARAGHERAFEAIVKRYRRPLLAACARMVPEARAEDVLQQALVSAWGALRRGDEVRDLRAWLFRIVRNAAVSDHRRAGHEPPELLETLIAAPSPQEEAERRAVVQETLEAVAGLPERQRAALLRIAVQGRSQDEVADELGVSRIAVRQLVHRARTTLRAATSALMPFPLVEWLASAGTGAEPMSLRIAQLVAGAGGAGASATLLKAGAVAGVAATAAVSAPMVAQHRPARAHPVAATATATPTPTPTPGAAAPARPVSAAAVDRHPARGLQRPAPGGTSSSASRRSRDASRRSHPRATQGGGEDIAAHGGTGGDDHGGRGGGDDRGRRRGASSGDAHRGAAGGHDGDHVSAGADGSAGHATDDDSSADDGSDVVSARDHGSEDAEGRPGVPGVGAEPRRASPAATATPGAAPTEESDH
jgi:RNA polymerase sigma factor (sigma-70 family)